MDTSKLQAFAVLAKTLSFSKTAEELYSSQSTVSKQIAALEKELGSRLFIRNSRRVTLSPAGQAILPYAERMLQAQKDLLQALDESQQRLELHAIPTMTNYRFFKALTRFIGEHPEIVINMHETESELLADKLRGPQDLLFVREWGGKQPAGAEYLELERDDLAVYVNCQHPLARQKEISVADLRGARFLTLSDKTGFKSLITDLCREVGFEPQFFYQGERIGAIMEMVRQNLGIALLTQKAVGTSQLPGIKRVSLRGPVSSHLYLVRKPGQHSQAQELFWQAMQNYSKSE